VGCAAALRQGEKLKEKQEGKGKAAHCHP